MSVELQELEALADPAKAAEMLAYHKAPRRYLGVSVPQITELADGWRAERTVEERVALADALWQTDIHEARVAAAKLLRQARMRPDEAAWALICSWVPQFDAWAIADHACDAGQRRLLADPSRVETVESWTTSEHMWSQTSSGSWAQNSTTAASPISQLTGRGDLHSPSAARRGSSSCPYAPCSRGSSSVMTASRYTTLTGWACQIFSAYSCTERSDEK